jgi:hypothetical protein
MANVFDYQYSSYLLRLDAIHYGEVCSRNLHDSSGSMLQYYYIFILLCLIRFRNDILYYHSKFLVLWYLLQVVM